MKRLAAALALSLALAAPARADILTLDDGSKIEGEIVRETEKEIEVKIPYGSTTLPRERVVKIEKKPSPEQELQARRAKLDAKDAGGRVDLARWALERHFPREKAAELAVEAWRITPGDDGAIDVLVSKLDYHYEKDVWVDPEHWYPTHGYVRKGTGFITTEEQTALDAAALVAKLKASLAAAESDVKRAEDAIASGPAREAKAKKTADDLESDGKALALEKETTKATLEARETDLKIAVDKTLAARRDMELAERQPCPQDAAGKQSWTDCCTRTRLLLNQAILDEDRARGARDGALANLDLMTRKQQNVLDKQRSAKSALDAVRAEVKAAEAALPGRKAARDAASERLAAGVAAEAAAKTAVEKRKLQDAKDAGDRLAALKALKK